MPGIASLEKNKFVCARCSGTVGNDATTGNDARAKEVSGRRIDLAEPPMILGDWEAEEHLRRVERALRTTSQRAPGDASSESPRFRFDPPHPQLATLPAPDRRGTRPADHETRAKAGGSSFAWTAISLGLMAFACGAVLLTWSFYAGRGDLWSLGMPITLAGQCGLVLGLVLQLERLWQTGSDNSTKLDQFDERLDELKHTTTLLGTKQHSHSGAFYSHLSDGASSQLLLADLKSQLDLLAVRMATDRRR